MKGLNKLGYLDQYKLLKHRYGQPYYYSEFPHVIQLDLSNRCGQKYCGVHCVYCRPQNDIARGIKKHASMSQEVLAWVLEDVKVYGENMGFICDFLDGDGLDPELPEKRVQIKKASPNLTVQTFTCGTRTENAHLLCDKNLDWICVTLSAHNDAVYRKVYRSTRFNDVLKTMKYITDHRLPHQILEVHYVITQYNIDYMRDWLNLMKSDFPDWTPKFSPLVNTGSDDPSNLACGEISTREQENEIRKIDGTAFWDRRELDMRQPCLLFHNASVTANGDLLQCCRWDKMDWSYGKAEDYIGNGLRFRDYWSRKLANKLDNPFCDRCNLKADDWQKRLADFKVVAQFNP
jgi:MoaA/NifB/PqqE/SkfB family radical SAM enzyme